MKMALKQRIITIVAFSSSVFFISYISNNLEFLGERSFFVRAILINIPIFSGLVSIYPLFPFFTRRPIRYCAVICLPAIIPAFLYYLLLFPARMVGGVEALQLDSAFFSEPSSNGIIEIGFQYPIYTPSISVKNGEPFTRKIDFFLRIINQQGEKSLFRAVRADIPGSNLSVESSARGLLSANSNYLLNPIALAPGKEAIGRPIFIISNLEGAAAFTEALNQDYQAHFELRDSESGELLLEFPVNRI